MPKQILRVEPIHSSQAFASKWKHNMRLEEISNADSSKTWKNEQLIRLPIGETYLTCFEKGWPAFLIMIPIKYAKTGYGDLKYFYPSVRGNCLRNLLWSSGRSIPFSSCEIS